MVFTPTLSKFGVPLVPGVNGLGMLMPKLKYRFRVTMDRFAGFGPTLDLTRQVKTASRPQVQFGETAIHSYNNVMYVPQKPTWQPVEIVIADDITSAVSRLISAQLQLQHNFFQQTSATSAGQFKFRTKIETLDGGNIGVLEAWYLEGCYLQNVTYDTFDYSSSEPMQISLTIRYDNATQDTIPQTAVTTPLAGA
tara:strand:- start:27816 stop:28400 length:585 start_codon:yes stop_codon:yes gene_type:complete